ncbi:MAG: hypothetical protein ABJC05_10150 [Pyrinomonadaceae bacterium]
MADNSEKFDKEDSPKFSDEMIRRFLFGRLNAVEQMTFEEDLFADERLETRVRLAECELTDDYAFGRLSAAERELFEQRFLVSTARQQQLNVAKALRDRFTSASDVAQTASLRSQPVQTTAPSAGMTIGERLQRLLGLNQPSWRLAFSVVILILLIGTVWSVLREPHIRNKFFAKRRPAPAATPNPDPQEAHHAIKASPTPLQAATPSPPEPERPAPVPGAVVLVPENRYDRDRIAQVRLARDARDLQVQLEFKNNQPATYRAELLTVAGQSVFTEGSLKPAAGGTTIDFAVPVRFVKAGDYQVKLSRVTNGIDEGVATYYFRVQ